MTSRRLEQLLWIATALVATAATANTVVRQHTKVRDTAPAVGGGMAQRRASPQHGSVADQLRDIVGGNLFRRERSAADSVPTLPQPVGPPKPPPPPKPRLILRGLVGGPPWNAILDGIPGHDGSYVVRAGD